MPPVARPLAILLMLTGCTAFDPLLLRYENLPTCDMREPITGRCREVRNQWGGVVDGRIHQPKEARRGG